MAPSRLTVRFILATLFVSGAVFLCVFFSIHLLLALIALKLFLFALEPLAKKRSWGSEGRLTRYLNRPRLIDESKRLCIDPGRGL